MLSRRLSKASAALLAGAIAFLAVLPAGALAADGPGKIAIDSSGQVRFIADPALYQADELTKKAGGLGAYRDAAGHQITVRIPKALVGHFAEADVASVGEPVALQASRFDAGSIASIEASVKALRTKLEADQAIASGYDIQQDFFAIESSAPESIFGEIEARYPGLVAYTYAHLARLSRHDDGPPHWGGAELAVSSSNHSIQCTSGYTIRIGSTNYMVTAGHCYPGLASVYGGTGLSWGRITGRRDYPNTDVELIGDTSYAGDIYISAGASEQVKGYTPGSVGSYPYCISGAVTGNYCDYTETAANVTYTDPDGTTTGLIKLQGHSMIFGDSGAPAYANSSGYAFILGSLVGGQYLCGSCTQYIQPWYSRVRTLYGASLVTG